MSEKQYKLNLHEITVTAKKPKHKAPNIFKEDWDSLFGKKRVSGVNRAWKRNPKYMQGLQDVNNTIGAVASLPIVGMAYNIPLLAGAMNLTGAYEGITDIVKNNRFGSAYNNFKSGNIVKGLKDVGSGALDILMSVPVVGKLKALKNIGTNPRTPSELKYLLNKKYRDRVKSYSNLDPSIKFNEDGYVNTNFLQKSKNIDNEISRLKDISSQLNYRHDDNPNKLMQSLFSHLYKYGSSERKELLTQPFVEGRNKPDYINKPTKYIDEFGNTTEAQIPTVSLGKKSLKFELVGENENLYPYGSNNLVEYRLYLPEKIQAAIQARNSRLTNIIGEDGTLGGSTSLMENGILAGVPGDDDLITTSSRLPNLMEKLKATRIQNLRGNLGQKVRSLFLRADEEGLRIGDIDVIQERNGRAYGLMAHEIYEQYDPEDYQRIRELFEREQSYNEYRRLPTQSISEKELPVDAETLYQYFIKNKHSKGLSDILTSHKLKHRQRVFSILSNRDSNVQAKVALNLDNKTLSYFGKKITLPDGFDFSDVKANKEFLKLYGLPTELATDPKAMENISRYLYFSKGSITRGVKIRDLRTDRGKGNLLPKNLTEEEFDDVLRSAQGTTDSPLNSNASGGGGNTTLGDRGGGTFGDDLSIGLVRLRDKVNNPMKLHEYLTLVNSKITAELANALNKLPLRYPLREGDSFKQVLMATRGLSYRENAQVSRILDTDFIVGDPYGDKGLYVGRYWLEGLRGRTYSKPNDITFEHGSFEPFSSMSNDVYHPLSAEELLEFKNAISRQGNVKLSRLTDLVELYVNNRKRLLKKASFIDKSIRLLKNKSYNLSDMHYDKIIETRNNYARRAYNLRDMETNLLLNIYGTGALLLSAPVVGFGSYHVTQAMNRDKEIYDWLSNKGYDYFTSMKDMKKEDSEELKRILKKYGKDEKSWEDDVYKNNQEFTRYAELNKEVK